jgi:hypothetical protein
MDNSQNYLQSRINSFFHPFCILAWDRLRFRDLTVCVTATNEPRKPTVGSEAFWRPVRPQTGLVHAYIQYLISFGALWWIGWQRERPSAALF